MPKRKSESKEDKWKKKMKKYEKKLAKKSRRRMIYSDDEIENEDLDNKVQEVDEDVVGNGGMYDDTPAEPAALAPIEPAASSVGASQSVEPGASQQQECDNNSEQVEIDPELLKALGDYTDEAVEWGPDINEYVAKRWLITLKEGLKKEEREGLLKKYLVPTNCKLIQAPKLNPEISAMLSDSSRNRDTRLAHKQAQLGCALSMLGKVMSNILINEYDKAELVRGLSEVGRILTDSHYLETETRRSLIIPVIDKTYIDPFKERKRDIYLFGDNLGEFIKSSRGIKKTGQLIQPSSNLNWRAPPPRTAQQYRPRGAARGRGGGYRTAAAPSARGAPRRAPPPPPPPGAPRRAPASATTQIPASAARYPATQRRNR